MLPSPLPGYEDVEQMRSLLQKAIKTINRYEYSALGTFADCSPRAIHSMSGALALRILSQKYIVDCGWSFKLVCSQQSSQEVVVLLSAPCLYFHTQGEQNCCSDR